MGKFLAIVRHEYRKIVLRWTFLLSTFLFPVFAVGVSVVPAVIFSITGEPVRLVVVDRKGELSPRIRAALAPEKVEESRLAANNVDIGSQLNQSQEEKLKRTSSQIEASADFIEYSAGSRSDAEVRADLRGKMMAKQIDGFLIVPENAFAADAQFEYFSRKSGDFVVNKMLEDAVNEAVRSQRLADASIEEAKLKEINRHVGFTVKRIDESGESASEGLFAVAFGLGLIIYLTLAIYGQQVLGAVVEEKETRIAEILFSSTKPFLLMLGKLVGVGLAGLTQLGTWLATGAAVLAYGLIAAMGSGLDFQLPAISPMMIAFFLLYFLLGFFVYASIYALIGSMVTTVQEGGQFALLPTLLLLAGFYFEMAVIRDPNSRMSFWVSMAPFFSPVTMPIRILTDMPPWWQILLSVVINVFTGALLVWIAGRVYRVGMMMYGKKATIPEVLRWIRQS